MPRSSRITSEPFELRACTECRRRKTKCSGTAPCLYCSRAKKACIFGPPPSRTPLTRKNLDETERRCASLMALLRKLNPDVDIAEALKGVPVTSREDNELTIEGLESVNSDKESPTSPSSFEWSEASLTSTSCLRKESLDGMVSLPIERAESGYLGNSSGSCILRTISDLLPEAPGPQAVRHEQSSPTDAGQTENPLLSENLNNAALLDNLIDTYFRLYNRSYPILHESTFRQKYQKRHHIHIRSSWHLIFYLVLAIGDWILAGASETEPSRYFMAAQSRMSMRMLESGTLLTVQAFLLMGNFLQKRDRPNTGYNFIGIAHRMALGLGLHREPPAEITANTLFNERRRVVWWIVYCFDSGFSLTTGRPLMSSDCFIETRLPQNIDDSGCTLNSILPAPIAKPTTYSAIIAQAQLASIGNMVYTDVIAASNKDLDLRISRSLDHQLKAWRLSLPIYHTAQDIPSWFRGPRAIVGWKEQNLRMMLWWGSQRLCKLPSDKQEAQNMCHYAAVETIQDITTFCLDYPDLLHIGLSWYATYFLFQATVILTFHHLRPCQPMTSRLGTVNEELWMFSMSRACDCLSYLSRSNKSAARCLEVLDRIRDRSQQSQPLSTPVRESQENDEPHVTQIQENTGMYSAALAVDPSLQMFLDDISWHENIFEGLQGFPITEEIGSFDYIPANSLTANNLDGWSMLADQSLEPT